MRRAGRLVLVGLAGVLGLAWGVLAAPPSGTGVDFVRDVRPIFASHCYECHGPANQKGKLRWDRRDSVLKREVIKPGSPGESTLIEVITSQDPDTLMPPPGKGERLNPAQVTLLKSWIEQGAVWPDAAAEAPDYRLDHWSFKRPVRPAIPQVKNPIDAFVLAHLEKEGLHPSPEADRYALIRRVSIDLTGLPPTLAQVDAFVNDSSANAYENLVDRLLASPAYGERWAQVWLDLARYADSRGYASDSPRTIWRWRDWVMGAINSNMPYDQFTVEQLAGDMLPKPTQEQILATAFHRNTMTNDEGGTDDEEFRVAAVKDRVSTTLQVWMGLTVGCAECHDHKYDPITQQDFYRLFAVFNQTEDADKGDESPRLSMALPQFAGEVAKLEGEIAGLEKELERVTPELKAEQVAWEKELGGGIAWRNIKAEMESQAGAKLTPQPDGSVLVSGKDAAKDIYTLSLPPSPALVTAIRLEVLPDDSLPKRGPGRAYSGSFVLTHFSVEKDDPMLVEAGPDAVGQKLASAYDDYSQKGMEAAKAIEKGDGKGWSVDGEIGKPHAATFVLDKPIAPGTPLIIRMEQLYGTEGTTLGKFRISLSTDPLAAKKAAMPQDILKLLEISAEKRTPAQHEQLAKYYRANVSPSLKVVRDKVATLKKQVVAKSVETPILKELPKEKQRKSFVLVRGNFLDKGAEVKPGVPAFLPQPPTTRPVDRLMLAQWITSDQNPLTARVTVNRYWEHLLGVGLVETSDDFGMRGKAPTHPELMDWLATEFMRNHWDVKGLLRLIVTSATYRQSSRMTGDLVERDPQNLLLAHGPRFRCSAEMIRDQALAASGLLSPSIGGPSVRPPQPRTGTSAAFGGTTDWTTSEGGDKYRRGLYTSWRRLSPYPSMIVFDAPSRNVCALKRPRTNTPLQALVTMNDPVFVEAAQALARRMIKEGGDNVESRLAYGFRLCFARPAREAELKRLVAAYQAALARYEKDPASSAAMASEPLGPIPEGIKPANLAAWSVVGNVLLNLDEMFAKR
jgi:hypothetical protein